MPCFSATKPNDLSDLICWSCETLRAYKRGLARMTHHLAQEDDVDSLFAAYEAQAAADRAETERKLHKHSQKPQKSMREIRDDGLAIPIASDNKGFQMLAAMGYQHGQGLGKGQSGRAAPVPIQVKGGKHGLGIEENKKRKQQQAEQQQQERVRKRAHMQQEMQAEHKVTSAMRAANRQAESQLLQARQVCETLDRLKGVESSEMWPPPPVVPDADSPPVSTGVQTGSTDAPPNKDALQDSMPWEDWPVQAKLAMVLDYLRQSYHYCLFCGCQYIDEDDLLANCPGLQEDDH